MPRTSRQKEKILYIAKILLEKSDENHAVTVPQFIEALDALGIKAERKSIYNDLETLSTFGLDICQSRSKTTGYYIASREFQMPELKLLVDSIQCSKFITTKKSLELIKKLETLCSADEAKALQRQVYILNRVKTPNEKIYYNVDKIHNALAKSKQITFVYTEWKLNFGSSEKVVKSPRKNGELYKISPWALSWDDENYYLIAYDKEKDMLKHYRVDKMEKIEITDEDCIGEKTFKKFDIASYSKAVFSMYGGTMTDVKMSFSNDLVGVVVDRFGKDVFITKETENSFVAHFKAVVSPQFYGWIFALGSGAKLLAPKKAVQGFTEYLQKVCENYPN